MNTLTTVSRFLIGLVLCHMHVFCQAQINAYSIDQTVTLASNSFSIDVNGDSSEDYTFEIYTLTEMTTAARVISLGGSSVMDNSTFGYPDALDCGDGVFEPYSEGNAVLGTDVGGGGLFTGEGLKYLGLNIHVAGESQRGWISLEVSADNDTIFLHEVGYALEIGEGITAGQTSAQIEEPLCDLVYTIGSQSEIEVAIPTTGNGLPPMAPLYVSTYAGGLLLGEDSCFGGPCTHLAFNGAGMDTITTCIEFMDVSNFSCPGDTLTCCLTQVWDAGLQFWQPIDASTSIATTTVIPALLFPVPARDHLNVRGDFEWVRIIDMSGRVLLNSVQNSAIDVSGVPEGFYIVEVMSSKAKHTETIQILR